MSAPGVDGARAPNAPKGAAAGGAARADGAVRPPARLEVAGLAASYNGGPPALHGVTFTAHAGQAVAVLGPNGGGKTTLFRALLGELGTVTGSVKIDGATAYVPQTERSRLDFPVSALDVALMGAYARTLWYRRIPAADRALARAALERVGLAEHARKPFGAMSGGQRQRVLIARALVQDAGVLLLDEPFAGVDQTSEEAIMGILDDLRGEGPGPAHRHARRRAGTPLGSRPVRARGADRLRPAGRHADERRPRSDLRRGDRAAGLRPPRRRRPAPRALMAGPAAPRP